MSFFLKVRALALSKLFQSPSSLQEVCDKSYELCAAERQSVAPAICLPRDVDRVTGVEPYTTLEQEMKRIRGGEQVNRATTVYELSHVTMSRGRLFKAGWKDRLLEDAPPSNAPRQIRQHGTLTSTFLGCRYFGHWMTDDLTLGIAAEEMGDPVTPERKAYQHEEEFNHLFQLRPSVVSRARFEKLTFFDDVGQNSYKKQRYQEMRRRLLKHCPASSGRRIFLHRSGGGVGRVLENEAEIAEWLEQRGFAIIDPSRLGGLELAQRMAGAEIIMGMEGSQLAHALYTIAEHGVLCALQPPYRFNNVFKGHADCVGFRYAFMAGTASPGGFTIPLDEMRELVDRLEKVVG